MSPLFPLPLPQIDGRGLALLAALNVETQPLTLAQIADARAFDCGDVDEHVLRAVLGLDEAIPLLGIEPFDGAGSHDVSSATRSAELESAPSRTTPGKGSRPPA